jgi:DNA polymerase-3 subunit epsilon
LLAHQIPAAAVTALSALLDHARRNTCRIWAEQSPYDLKDQLKRRGYRWNAGADGSLRCWYVDVDADKRETELRFLRHEIYQRDVSLRCVEFSALERFSSRVGRHFGATRLAGSQIREKAACQAMTIRET